MSADTNDEVALGQDLAEKLADHLIRMGASSVTIPVDAGGLKLTVRVDYGTPEEVVPFHGMYPSKVERMLCLLEEAAEVVVEGCKTLRHGPASYHPQDPDCTPNIVRLAKEVGNLEYVRDQMMVEGDITDIAIQKGFEAKKINWPIYTHHQKKG